MRLPRSAWPTVFLCAALPLAALTAAGQSESPQAPPASLNGKGAVSLKQWESRLSQGQVSTEEIARVAHEALEAQADDKTPWNIQWGDFVEAAHRQGLLPADLTIHTDEAVKWYRAQTLEWYRKSADLGNQEAKPWISSHP